MARISGDDNIHLARTGRFKLNGIFKVRRLTLKGGCDSRLADRDYCQMILKHPQAIPQLCIAECLTQNIGNIAKGQVGNDTLSSPSPHHG